MSCRKVYYTFADDAVTLLVQGDQDCVVGRQQGELMHGELRSVRAALRYLEVPNAGHDLGALLTGGGLEEMENMVDRYLIGCAPFASE